MSNDATVPLLPLSRRSLDVERDDYDSDDDTLVSSRASSGGTASPKFSRLSAPLLLIPISRRWRRPRPLRARSRLLLIFALALASTFLLVPLFIHLITAPAFPAKIPSPYDDIAIVSLASSLSRLRKTLPYTLRTLHAQSVRPKEIRIYLPEGEERDVIQLQESGGLSPEFETGNVRMFFVPDQGPGTKFLPLLTEHLTLASNPDPHSAHYLSRPLIILDDDHLYTPSLISTLLTTHFATTPDSPFKPRIPTANTSTPIAHDPDAYPAPNMTSAAFGLRGQRIRPNLHWANPYYANGRYTVHGWQIDAPYRTGYLTANAGYLILPSYFVPHHLLPASSPHPPAEPYTAHAAVLNYTGAPSPARLVDDIWINAHLSLTAHPRIILPLPASPPSLALDQVFGSQLLTRKMRSEGVSRQDANDAMIAYFRDAWAQEGGVWFREEEALVDEEGVVEQGGVQERGESSDPLWSSWWRRKVMNRVWAVGLVWRSFVVGFDTTKAP
ncbi:hypothetical protein GLOTRDRAFT_136980 [Gloeophyllum trabeum ATCC 11539]|uniref:Uncharacterized protein n=1 Tax=Gloeophyllum trabeum (strain ATCC 11539 / FP-39264 / Madison 617) TaxID=670483 RepID=S7QEI4_GLOTA|nr:uncharacterized protein GLOTRDRAFT_136980 [Gloeophyllum trabeum ATCC 11539]EPQ58231.1 hypothetical protein GLOTRDRAFT_136980 [Gloeophyllum trabeum ATCC 11539]